MELPKNPYHVIKNYLDKDYCKTMASYFIENMEEDPRESYGTFGLGGRTYFFDEENPATKPYDPDMKLYEMIHFGYKFFLENYPISGEFELNRSHANLMFEGATLHDHKDDRNFDEPIEDLGSKTHVMGLFLTDDYEGGELYFQDYDVSLKPEIGDLVFFPGYYTRHGVRQVTSGVRINILSHYFDISDRSKINPSYTVHKK
jgi:hypothetical protein